METNQSVKASMLAIITFITGMFINIPNTEARIYKSFSAPIKNNSINLTGVKEELEVNELDIKPRNVMLKLHSEKINSIEIDIDVEQLRQIKNARKKALELQKQKEEEERKKAEEAKIAEEKKQADEKAQTLTAQSGSSISYDELVAKLNRSLSSDLTGKGEIFAKYAVELGIDPYMAVAIILHETGCKWSCSSLLRQCNNVGGMKGSPGCNGGAYKSFSSLDEGIIAYINNLYNNYISQGLTTPEAMGPKYAASTTWASKVRAYMNEIEAN